MKTRVIAIPEMTIDLFAEKHGLEMVVRERPSEMAKTHQRYYASFPNLEIVADSVLVSKSGNGDTPESAINQYSSLISEQYVTLDGGKNKLTVPRLI